MSLMPPTRREIVKTAWPIILANCAVPLLGLVDTAVIGHLGSSGDLAAIALGALIFTFVYWAFGFLRMGTTGAVAQAAGAQDKEALLGALSRGLGLAVLIGFALLLMQFGLRGLALALLDASAQAESLTRDYFHIRIWSAPAVLALYALMGVLVGLGLSRRLLALQLVLNISNILLDVYFAAYLGWGVQGVAAGTVIAEYLALAYALWLLKAVLHERQLAIKEVWQPAAWRWSALRPMLLNNANLAARTLLMLCTFAWFTNQSAQFGDEQLAANHILLQLISFSAYFLDGFAFAAESYVGKAIGAAALPVFDAAVQRSTELAATTALMLSGLLWLGGDLFIRGLTDLPEVQVLAQHYLPAVVAYVFLSFPAFQLDGIFIAALRGRELRQASMLSVLGFLALCTVLGANESVAMLWLAFIAYVVLRGLTLAFYFPGLRTSLRGESA